MPLAIAWGSFRALAAMLEDHQRRCDALVAAAATTMTRGEAGESSSSAAAATAARREEATTGGEGEALEATLAADEEAAAMLRRRRRMQGGAAVVMVAMLIACMPARRWRWFHKMSLWQHWFEYFGVKVVGPPPPKVRVKGRCFACSQGTVMSSLFRPVALTSACREPPQTRIRRHPRNRACTR